MEEESEEENKDPADLTTGEPGYKWECVAVTLHEYNEFLDTIRKSKDADEKALRSQIEEHVLPLLEKAEEAQQRKRMKREKEQLAVHMIAGAKRSSRLAGKLEKERAEREAIEAARKHEADLEEARREQAKQEQREGDRQSRMMTREQRIKDREQKRILHEAELERIAQEQEKVNQGESRSSARNLQLELEKSQKNLAELSQEDQWIFDCSGCGVYGENLVSSIPLATVFAMGSYLTLCRTMAATVLPVKSAMSGSTVTVLVFDKRTPKKKTSTFSARTASKKKKTLFSPRSRL